LILRDKPEAVAYRVDTLRIAKRGEASQALFKLLDGDVMLATLDSQKAQAEVRPGEVHQLVKGDGANRAEVRLAEQTLDTIRVARPRGRAQ
jgi:hypothetical protein